jgi:hypothetical protein
MSKDTVNREDVEQLHHTGWSFRVKTVKKKQYLSARKGGEEKGLGLYTQDLRKLISEFSKPRQRNGGTIDGEPSDTLSTYTVTVFVPLLQLSPTEVEFSQGEIERAVFDIRFEMARVKTVDCEHSWNGFCHYWHFMTGSKRLESIYERFGVEECLLPVMSHHSQSEEESRDSLCVTELLCLNCEKYQPRKKRESK